MHLDLLLTSGKTSVDKRLHELVSITGTPQHVLFSAAEYSLAATGKRLRPLLTLATVLDFGGDIDLALDPACAIELIHTYSLIHDDLPCMDDDDYRRGKPSLHKQYPESIAILTGDFFLTFAFEVLTNVKKLTPIQKLQLINTLAKRSGGLGMIGGQIVDIQQDVTPLDEYALQYMHEHKTGALIQCCVEFGAIICSLNPKETESLCAFAKHLGYAFQIIDDILDVTKSSQELGKPTHSDIKNNKVTSVSLLGLDKARNLAKNLTLQALSSLPDQAKLLKSLAEKMLQRSF